MVQAPVKERSINGKRFLTLPEYCRVYGYSRQRVWHQIKYGTLPKDKVYQDIYSGLWWVCVE